MKATGWQAHTVRGFVSILGSKGGENKVIQTLHGPKGLQDLEVAPGNSSSKRYLGHATCQGGVPASGRCRSPNKRRDGPVTSIYCSLTNLLNLGRYLRQTPILELLPPPRYLVVAPTNTVRIIRSQSGTTLRTMELGCAVRGDCSGCAINRHDPPAPCPLEGLNVRG